MRTHRGLDSGGFTLIELMIVVTLIAILSTIAIPNLMSARSNSNETAAIANLRNVWTGQAQFQGSVAADVDNDGAGEFGFFREIGGSVGVRTAADGSTVGKLLAPPPVTSFRGVNANGAVQRSGYFYTIILPDSAGAGVHETPTGAFAASIDADLAETTFCIYAWPSAYGGSGSRTFFVNQQGDMTWTEDASYSGAQFHASATDGMAFAPGGANTSISGTPAIGTVGRDGNSWRQVN